MVAALILALAFQEQAKTVEDRLKELEARLAGLEERSKKLADENAQLEKRLAGAKAAREGYAKQAAAAWVKRYAKEAEFTEKQSAEFEVLWADWTKADFQKPADAAAWKSREDTLRGMLTADQARALNRKVRDEQVQSIVAWAKFAKIAPERILDVEKAVVERLPFPGEVQNVLLAQAHPETFGWLKLYGALEQSLPDLSKVLTAEEHAALRDLVEKWKPRR